MTDTPSPDAARPGRRPRLRAAPIAKAACIGAVLVGFLVSLGELDALVQERDWMRDVARDAVSGLWGPPQEIVGPLLILPDSRQRGGGTEAWTESARRVVVPDDLDVSVTLDPETRRRGLYDIPVYTARVTIAGRFAPGTAPRGGAPDAALAVALTDASRLVGTPEATWDGTPVEIVPDQPEIARSVLGEQAVAARLALAPDALAAGGRFTLSFGVKGTGEIGLAPAGRAVSVDMRSAWPHPSFVGSRTAETHAISSDGFEATWRVGPFGRGLPATWLAGDAPDGEDPLAGLRRGGFGVALVQPVDPYRMTERALKYGMLFALYTVGAFVVMEIVFRRRLHWIHYLLTGASVATFFLLLLSLSEVIGFAPAYGLGAAGVVAQTGLYARSTLGDRRLALGFAGLLAALYAGLFVLLRLEDAALVTGSLALFVAIGVAMVLTRRLARPDTAAG